MSSCEIPDSVAFNISSMCPSGTAETKSPDRRSVCPPFHPNVPGGVNRPSVGPASAENHLKLGIIAGKNAEHLECVERVLNSLLSNIAGRDSELGRVVMNTGKVIRRGIAMPRLITQGRAGVMLAVWMLAANTYGTTPDVSQTAKQLVDSAHEAAIAGDSARICPAAQAVRIEPDNPVARWELGQIQVDGRWLSVEEAQRQAAADPAQARYRELRAESGETPEGQLALRVGVAGTILTTRPGFIGRACFPFNQAMKKRCAAWICAGTTANLLRAKK